MVHETGVEEGFLVRGFGRNMDLAAAGWIFKILEPV